MLEIIYIVKATLIKIPTGLFVENDKLILKCKRPSIAKTTLRKKNLHHLI